MFVPFSKLQFSINQKELIEIFIDFAIFDTSLQKGTNVATGSWFGVLILNTL